MKQLSKCQDIILALVRVAIGWHFLYEGIIKVLNPSWSSLPYLMDSQGIFGGLFRWMAGNSTILSSVDFINKWALVLVGAGLILGLFTRVAIIGGMLLLVMYITSHPSFIGAKYAMPMEGHYLWVDKNVIEFLTLSLLFVLPKSKLMSADSLICKNKS